MMEQGRSESVGRHFMGKCLPPPERQPVFPGEPFLAATVDEIPGKRLVQGDLAVNQKIRIELKGLCRAFPASKFMCFDQKS